MENPPNLVPKRVLLVDDSSGALMAMALLLKRLDIEIETAGDGEQAVQLLNEKSFDLLLSDVDMPNMGGFELLEWASANRPAMPVVLMSGSASGETGQTARRALAKGARGILSKPFLSGELERSVANFLR